MNIKSFIEIIFPPSDDEIRFYHSCDRLIQQAHLHYEPNLNVYYLYSYQNDDVKAMIRLAKFHHFKNAQEVLAEAVVHCLPQPLLSYTFVPIPLSSRREHKRGYNQVTEVLRRLPKDQITIDTRTLRRSRHTVAQTALSKKDRLSNLESAFVVRQPERIQNKHIILVDDVLTTGATMIAARKEIEKHSLASLTCLTFAH